MNSYRCGGIKTIRINRNKNSIRVEDTMRTNSFEHGITDAPMNSLRLWKHTPVLHECKADGVSVLRGKINISTHP